MTSTQTDRDGIPLEGDGVDSARRLHPSCATDRLRRSFEHERESGDSGPNTFTIAEAVVDRHMEADPRVVGRAAANLLALDHFDRETEYPKVAARNIREGDYVQHHGTTLKVLSVSDNAENRGPDRHLSIKLALLSNPDEVWQTVSHASYVEIPLIARPLPTDGGLS